jgi:hypothetical protein
MGRLSRTVLLSMLERAAGEVRIEVPREILLDLLVMAHEAASVHPTPLFTLRELEAMMLEHADGPAVTFDAQELKLLVNVALQAAPPVDQSGA